MVLLLGFPCGCDYESTVERRTSCFDACVAASADVQLEGQLDSALVLRDSLEHTRNGLAAYAGVASALRGFVQAMVDLHAGMPSGLTYEGNGRYALRPDFDTRVELQFYHASDTSYGHAGDLIDFNLFGPDSYFGSLGVKASSSISLSGVESSVDFTFDALGPGAELLGIASTARDSVAVDVGAFSTQLSKVIVHANVIVEHASDTANISFTMAPRARAVGTVGNGSIALTMGGFVGTGAKFDQTLALEAVELKMQNAGGAFDGSVRLTSTSPDFGFSMLLSYDASAAADIVFGCPGATLALP